MPERPDFPLLPYSCIQGQYEFRRLLEIAYVMGPKGYGLLVSGERGTAKSTTVRSFACMMSGGKLPVTLPVNATDDRISGGWEIDSLLRGSGDPVWKAGLLEEAGAAGMLYIDDVNLLEDHVVNQILDVASTGVLTVQRDGRGLSESSVSFMLTGTMNPDEGPLRPQLLDRFGLFVPVEAERSRELRRAILLTRLKFDNELEKWHSVQGSAWIRECRQEDERRKKELEAAGKRAKNIHLEEHPALADLCVDVTDAFNVVGHRADLVMSYAACATTAIDNREKPTADDVAKVAPYAIMHRLRNSDYSDVPRWGDEEKALLAQVIAKG